MASAAPAAALPGTALARAALAGAEPPGGGLPPAGRGAHAQLQARIAHAQRTATAELAELASHARATDRAAPASQPFRRLCRRVCSNSCVKARDGRCQDGWIGDDNPLGKPDCALGADCADCGGRHLCTIPGTQMQLPLSVLPSAPTSALRISQILFMVMGSSRYKHRTLLTHRSWCAGEGVRCIFFADEDVANGHTASDTASSVGRDPFASVRVQPATHPTRCCVRRRGGASFFCDRHRAATLRAQYRFLPALQVVRSSAAFGSGRFRWVVVVDDDTFVFARKLRWVLSRLDYAKPLYLGDFGSSGDATQMRIPYFACGGGGTVLSAAALRQMEVRTHWNCC